MRMKMKGGAEKGMQVGGGRGGGRSEGGVSRVSGVSWWACELSVPGGGRGRTGVSVGFMYSRVSSEGASFLLLAVLMTPFLWSAVSTLIVPWPRDGRQHLPSPPPSRHCPALTNTCLVCGSSLNYLHCLALSLGRGLGNAASLPWRVVEVDLDTIIHWDYIFLESILLHFRVMYGIIAWPSSWRQSVFIMEGS